MRGSKHGKIVAFGSVIGLCEIDLSDGDGGKGDSEETVGGGGMKGDIEASERLADIVEAVLEGNLALGFDAAGHGVLGILDGQQPGRHGTRAGAVACSRDLELKSFMGSVVVVEVPIAIEAALSLEKVEPIMAGEQVVLKGTVKALVLALGLGVKGSPVDDLDAQAHQPDREASVVEAGARPGRAVVTEDLPWETIEAKYALEVPLDGICLLVGASSQADRVTAAVIQNGERMTAAPALQSEVALEVHLPKLVRF